EVRALDAVASLKRSAADGERFGVVFLDPPYAHAHRLAPALGEGVPAVLTPDGLAVVESDARAPLSLPLALLRERRYGDTTIRIYGVETSERLDCGPR
ncbi:MAG: RsmD family RNA methyltransferase, partial [Solirubrobacteraceae bacterium]